MPYRRAPRSRGSGCLRSEPWIPLPERLFQFVIENLGSHLEQEMSSPQRPLHLLLLDEPPAHDLVDRRFDERRADPFSLSPSITEVRNELAVVLDVGLELRHSVRDLGGWD